MNRNETLAQLVELTDKITALTTITVENGLTLREKVALSFHNQEMSNFVTELKYEHIKKHNNESNLLSLCKSCHMKTNIFRSYWKQVFRQDFLSRRLYAMWVLSI